MERSPAESTWRRKSAPAFFITFPAPDRARARRPRRRKWWKRRPRRALSPSRPRRTLRAVSERQWCRCAVALCRARLVHPARCPPHRFVVRPSTVVVAAACRRVLIWRARRLIRRVTEACHDRISDLAACHEQQHDRVSAEHNARASCGLHAVDGSAAREGPGCGTSRCVAAPPARARSKELKVPGATMHSAFRTPSDSMFE